MKLTLTEFGNYVSKKYNGSLIPLNYSHLVKGMLLQYLVKKILDDEDCYYIEADAVGKGADFNLDLSPHIIPIECKNEKDHKESPKSVETDIISRFDNFLKNSPKILITSPVSYTPNAKRILKEDNIQLIIIPNDINNLDELEKISDMLHAKIISAIYKFRHYKQYNLDQVDPKYNEGVDTSYVEYSYYDPLLLPLLCTTICPPPIILLYIVFHMLIIYTISSISYCPLYRPISTLFRFYPHLYPPIVLYCISYILSYVTMSYLAPIGYRSSMFDSS